MKRLELIVHGRVQGVFFRGDTVKQATRLGLVGEVRNRKDGTVRIVAEGPEEQLQRLVEWAEDGPDAAAVTDHDTQWAAPTGEYATFRQAD